MLSIVRWLSEHVYLKKNLINRHVNLCGYQFHYPLPQTIQYSETSFFLFVCYFQTGEEYIFFDLSFNAIQSSRFTLHIYIYMVLESIAHDKVKKKKT